MEFIRKIAILVCLCLCVFSCKTVIPVALLEVIPLPREVMIEEDSEYEPVFSVMKILEISEVNGVQKYVIAKVEADGKDIENSAMGEIAADLSFENPLGIIKVISRTGDFLRCSIESSTHKIPNNSYIRIQIGEKEKEKEDSDTKKDK